MARAAVAAGADGILVEVHHQPDKALSDGPQSIYPSQFADMMNEMEQIAPDRASQPAPRHAHRGQCGGHACRQGPLNAVPARAGDDRRGSPVLSLLLSR